MLDLHETVSSIAELLTSWRLFLSLAVTVGLVVLVLMLVPNEIARWIICTPIVILGAIGSFYWQAKADRL